MNGDQTDFRSHKSLRCDCGFEVEPWHGLEILSRVAVRQGCHSCICLGFSWGECFRRAMSILADSKALNSTQLSPLGSITLSFGR